MTTTYTVSAPTRFQTAATALTDPVDAMADLAKRLSLASAGAVVLFVSSKYEPAVLAREIKRHVSCPVLCCTTAGEIHSDLGYFDGGISAVAIHGCQATIHTIDPWMSDDQIGRTFAEEQSLIVDPTEDGVNCVGLLVVDGLCNAEERMIDVLQRHLPSIPIVGGSAGDDQTFTETRVLVDGEFQRGIGRLMVIKGSFTAIPFQTHHCVTTGKRMIVTEADAERRRLIALDGYPAAERLAELLSVTTHCLRSPDASCGPLLRRMGESYYVRAIRRIEPDLSLSLFCGVRAGDVLHLGAPGDLVDSTAVYLSSLRHAEVKPDLILGFECILRRKELVRNQRVAEMNRLLSGFNFAGFSTYGEQFDGLHVSQTMTGVALWKI